MLIINRGAAKRELGQMSAAEKDMQKALQLAQEQEEKSKVDGE